MATHLRENATHLNKVEGSIREGTVFPTNSGVAGLRDGDWFYHTSRNILYIYLSGVWWGRLCA